MGYFPFFIDLAGRAGLVVGGGSTALRKLEKLIRAAGIENIDFANRFTALKLHFGEEGNLA